MRDMWRMDVDTDGSLSGALAALCLRRKAACVGLQFTVHACWSLCALLKSVAPCPLYLGVLP